MPKPWDATLITLTLWNVVELYGCLFEPLNDMYEISVGGNKWKHQHATFWNLAACILFVVQSFLRW